MRTPASVLGTIRTRYHAAWRDWLLEPLPGRIAFPLDAPSADQIARRAAEVEAWLAEWETWRQQHPALSLRSGIRHTMIGPQSIVTHLDAEDVDALVSADPDLSRHWRTARQRWQQLLEVPAPATLRPHLSQIIDLGQTDFDILLAAIEWLAANPRSGLTPRQVPIPGMHTKWLARHRRFVLAALGHSPTNTADDALTVGRPNPREASDDDLTAGDLDFLGLRALPREIDVILADPADRAALAGLQHLRSPIIELTSLPLHPHTVLIVENKESAYLVPDHPALIVVHSLGNHLDALTELPWLVEAPVLLYWGDLDRAGLTLLSRARARQPRLRSVLMSDAVVRAHLHLAVPERAHRIDPPLPTLTVDEQAALAAITGVFDGQHAQLEQERLPADLVIATLEQTLNSDTLHDSS